MLSKKQAIVTALILAQKYTAARQKRLVVDKVAAGLKKLESELKQQVMDTLESNKVNAVGDQAHVYELVRHDEPSVDDWAKLQKHIQKTGEFELLFKRVNPASVKERWDLGEPVPGVSKFPTISLSVTRARGA